MGNSLLTIDMITRESLRVLQNNLVLVRNVNRQYDSSFAQTGAKIGSMSALIAAELDNLLMGGRCIRSPINSEQASFN